MNPPDGDFEKELGCIDPAAPSRRLRISIAEELNSITYRRRHVPASRWSLWGAWGVATTSALVAAILLIRDVAGLPTDVSVPVGQPNNVSGIATEDELRMVPVGEAGVLLVALDEGIVYMKTGEPVRKFRLQFVDTVRLSDPDAKAAIEISYPREEVRYVPVTTF